MPQSSSVARCQTIALTEIRRTNDEHLQPQEISTGRTSEQCKQKRLSNTLRIYRFFNETCLKNNQTTWQTQRSTKLNKVNQSLINFQATTKVQNSVRKVQNSRRIDRKVMRKSMVCIKNHGLSGRQKIGAFCALSHAGRVCAVAAGCPW